MKHILPTLSLACLLFSASALQASPILPGQAVVPEGVPNPSDPITILDETDGSFSFGSGSNLLSGTFEHGVMIDPFGLTCASCLDFYYQVGLDENVTIQGEPGEDDRGEIELDEELHGGIFHLFPGLFTGFDTNVAYVSEFGIAPLGAFRGPGGTYLDFAFTRPGDRTDYIHPGEYSAYLIVATNATSYDRSGILGVLGTAGPYNKPVFGEITGLFAPVAVPEPGSLSLLAAGVIGLLLASRRRKTVTSGF
jgi:hypothetical protein